MAASRVEPFSQIGGRKNEAFLPQSFSSSASPRSLTGEPLVVESKLPTASVSNKVEASTVVFPTADPVFTSRAACFGLGVARGPLLARKVDECLLEPGPDVDGGLVPEDLARPGDVRE